MLRGTAIKISGIVTVDGSDTVDSVTVSITEPPVFDPITELTVTGPAIVSDQAATVTGSAFEFVHQTEETYRTGAYAVKCKVTAGSFTALDEVYFILR